MLFSRPSVSNCVSETIGLNPNKALTCLIIPSMRHASILDTMWGRNTIGVDTLFLATLPYICNIGRPQLHGPRRCATGGKDAVVGMNMNCCFTSAKCKRSTFLLSHRIIHRAVLHVRSFLHREALEEENLRPHLQPEVIQSRILSSHCL